MKSLSTSDPPPNSAPRRRPLPLRALPLRALCVSVVLFLLALYAARCFWVAHQTQQQSVAEWNAERAWQQRLETIVEMKFAAEPTLSEWLAEWSRQSGVPSEIHAEQQARHGQRRIALTLKPTTARNALQTLARVYEFGWSPVDSNWVEIFPAGMVDDPLWIRTHRLTQDVKLADRQVAVLRGHLGSTAGPFIARQGMLTCVERQPDQLQIEVFLRRLNEALERVEPLSTSSAVVDPQAWQPILLDEDPQALADALSASKRPTTLDLQDVTLHEFARQLSLALDYPLIVDRQTERDHDRQFGGGLISCRVQDASLTDILSKVLPRRRLRAEPVASGRVIVLYGESHAPSSRQGLCFAYPVADLLQKSDGELGHDRLMTMVTEMFNSGRWSGPFGSVQLGGGFCGPVLVASNDLSLHEQIQALLAAVRSARSGTPGTSVRTQQFIPVPQELDTKLNQQAELHYIHVTLRDVAASLNNRFGLRVVLPDQDETIAEMKVWCHLPARPLRENLEHLLQSYGLTFSVVNQQVHVYRYVASHVDGSKAEHGFEVHNLRPLLQNNPRAARGIESLLIEFSGEFEWQRTGGEGNSVLYEELLILHQRPDGLDRAKQILQVLREEHFRSPREVARLSLEQKSRPVIHHVKLWSNDEERHWDAELHRRLAALDTLDVKDAELLPLLLQLAEKHGLPIVHPGSQWTDVDPLGVVTLSVVNEPVRDILQKLNAKRWNIRGGLLSTSAQQFRARHRVRWLFNVSDLVQPGGPLLPGQLQRTLYQRINLSQRPSSELAARIYMSQFLGVLGTLEECNIIQATLQELREGKLQASPAEQADPQFLETWAPLIKTTRESLP